MTRRATVFLFSSHLVCSVCACKEILSTSYKTFIHFLGWILSELREFLDEKKENKEAFGINSH